MWIIYIIGGILIIGVVSFFIGRNTKIKIQQREADQALYEKETALKNSIIQLQEEKASADQAYYEAQQKQNAELKQQELEVQRLDTKREELLRSIDDMKAAYEKISKDSQAAAKDLEIIAMQLAAENIEKRSKELEQEYRDYEERYQQEMLTLMKEAVQRYQEITATAQEASDHALSTLHGLQDKIDVIVETNKRAAQDEANKNFYRLQVTTQDLEEIAKIRSIEPYLRSAEPLNKVIWKVYYEKACNDMIGRVLGTAKKTGIYKITSLIDGKCYVGQSTDVAERWKQHIKRGIGADTPTRNKLYPVMLAIGVENFTFELLEECTTSELNDKEDYWQKVYHAIDFGYSIK